MPVYNWKDPEEERRAIERTRARSQRVATYRATTHVSTAQAVSQMAAYYPTMSPGVAVPLALGGVAPTDPVALKTATAEAKKNKRTRGTFSVFGDILLSPLKFGAEALDEVGGAISAGLKPVTRYGLAGLMAPFEAGTGVFRNIAAAGGEIVGGAAAGAITGAGVGGIAGAGIFSAPAAAIGGAIGGVVGGIAGGVAQMRGVDIEGEFRNPIAQTTLGQDIFGGKNIGQGYLPTGTAAPAQAAAARQAASLKGHALTPGRLLAASAFDVDTAPYKVLSGAIDLANAWKLDPANVAGVKAAQRMAKTRKFVPQITRAEQSVRQAAGAVDVADRPGVLVEAAQQWLTADKRGQGFVELVRTTDDFDDLRKMLPGVAPETLLDLADARTADEVIGHLLPRVEGEVPRGLMLERGLSERPTVASATGAAKVKISNLEVSRRVGRSRLFADLPGKEMNLFDHGAAIEDFNNLQRTANFAPDVLARNNRQLAENLRDGDYKAAIRTITHGFVGSADGALVKSGAAPELANKMERLMLSTMDDLERKAFFEQGLGTRVSAADIAGETFDLAAPSLINAELGTIFKIDRADVRAMRQVTGKFAPLYNHPTAGAIMRSSTAVMDAATSQVWKPFALLRGAYTVRVIAEEQIRMANSGMDSLFAHPLSYLAWMAADDGRLGKHLDRLGVTVKRGDVDVLGQAFTESPAAVERALRGHGNEFAAALGRKANKEHWMEGHVRQSFDRTWRRGEAEYNPALAERIAKLHEDPVARRVANGGVLDTDPQTFRTGPEAVRHWLDSGEGAEVRRAIGAVRSPVEADDMLGRYNKLVEDVVGSTVETSPGSLTPGPVAGGRPGAAVRTGVRGMPEAAARPLPPRPIPPKPPPPGRLSGEKYARRQEVARQQERYRKELAAWESEVAEIRRAQDLARAGPAATAGKLPPGPPRGQRAPVALAAPIYRGGDARLRQAIATGEIDGVPIYTDRGTINPEFRKQIDAIVDEGHGPMSVSGQGLADPTISERWDKAVEGLFNAFMGNRTAKLSRSPHFRQYYWREAERLAFSLKADDQARLLANMDAAELPDAMKAAIRKSVARGSGDLSLDQVDTLLKGRALDATRELLYDVSKRGQLSDVMRIIWPFAEAQKEVVKTWARLGAQNPNIPRRAHQVLQGGQGEGGVFYKDPQTGEMMFTYPGSQILTEKVFGVPIPLGNRVEGLSMFGSGVLPGFGPVMQMSARWLLPDKPQFDQVREIVDPFGESAEGGILEQFGPGWVRALITGKVADESDTAFGNDMMDVYNAGLSSGLFGNSTPEEIRDGLESAKSKARWLHIIRGGGMFLGAPSPPRPEFLAADQDGRWMMMDSLVKEYRDIWDKHPEDANARFLEKFGPGVFALVQPSTYAGGKILPESTTVAGTWAREHPDLAERYPAIYGVFAPSDADADFDIAVWARQKRTGERIPMEPDQRARYNNDKLASTIYYAAKDRFGPFPNKGQRTFLRTLNDSLVKEYPGYQVNLGLPEKVDTEQRINELITAVEDPELADNPVTEPIKLYLAAREKLNTAAQQSGLAQSVAKAKSTAGARAWLRTFGEALVSEYPGFSEVWDRVFDAELVDDTKLPEEVVVSA